MKKSFFLIVYLLLSSFIIVKAQLSTSSKLPFGLNDNYNNAYLTSLLSNHFNLSPFFKEYNIQYLRYPGGSIAHNYFWDGDNLSFNPKTNNYETRQLANNSAKTNTYANFLQFAKRNEITPIIQLNVDYYHKGNEIFLVEKPEHDNSEYKLENDRWNYILSNLREQLAFTHKYFDTVTWELGNEEYHRYNGSTYGAIVSKLSAEIKKAYPQDKIIVCIIQDAKDLFNTSLVDNIRKNNALNLIDFFAPHIYYLAQGAINSTTDLSQYLQKYKNHDIVSKYKSLFPANYNLKLFYTEYNVFQGNNKHKQFNTQLHALLYFLHLMNIYSYPEVFGIINHGFTNKVNAVFSAFKSPSSSTTATSTNNDIFEYVSPEAETFKIFFKECFSKPTKILYNEDAIVLKCSEGNIERYIILNFSNKKQTVNLGKSFTWSNISLNTRIYSFDNLYSTSWKASSINTTTTITNNTLAINPLTFEVIER